MSEREPVRYELDDGIVNVTIDRPERKNALSVEAMNALTDVWERVKKDQQARVVILTSTDCGVFSAGMDLKQAAEIRARDGVDILTLIRGPMQTQMRKVSKPIIAAMTGSLMAGGMLLAIKSDMRVGLRGTRAGHHRGQDGAWFAVGRAVAVDAGAAAGDGARSDRRDRPDRTARRSRLLNYLEDTPDAGSRTRPLQLARVIVEGAPLSVKAAKASVLAAMDLGCANGLVEADRLHVEAYASLDAIEGPRAFSEKRKPVWQGK